MNLFQKPVPVLLMLVLSPVVSTAEEPGDLAKLREGYQKDLSTVAAPVRARYAEKLQTLLKACVQRGDLDQAVAVRSELESLKGDASAGPANGAAAIAAFRKALSGTTWTWPTNYDPITVTFLEDGTFKTPPWGGKFTWEPVDKNSVKLMSEKFGSASMTFNDTLTAYEGFDFRTKNPLKGTRVMAGSAPAAKGGGGSGSGSSGSSVFGRTSQ